MVHVLQAPVYKIDCIAENIIERQSRAALLYESYTFIQFSNLGYPLSWCILVILKVRSYMFIQNSIK